MIRNILMIMLAASLATVAAEAQAKKLVLPAVAQQRIGITVRQLAPIAFGTFASYAGGGAITIDAGSGGRVVSGSISTLSNGDYGQAEFIISGQPGAEIQVAPPVSAHLGSAGNGSDMVITDFKVNPANIVTLNQQGIVKVKIGGTLRVPGHVPQGYYSGIFSISARYLR